MLTFLPPAASSEDKTDPNPSKSVESIVALLNSEEETIYSAAVELTAHLANEENLKAALCMGGVIPPLLRLLSGSDQTRTIAASAIACLAISGYFFKRKRHHHDGKT